MAKEAKISCSKRGDEALQKILLDNEEADSRGETQSQDVSQKVEMISVNDIAPNPFQPRRHFEEQKLAALAESLKDRGMLQPVALRKTESSLGFKYELIFGERRLRAARVAGLAKVPALVRDNVDDKEMKILTITENMQREDLNIGEKTLSVGVLQQEIGDTASTANILRLTRRSVERYVRIFKVVSASEMLLSLFQRDAHLIDFREAEALADIWRYLRQEDFSRFLDVATHEGIKQAIKLFRGPVGAGLSMKNKAQSVLCKVKETGTHLNLQMRYEKGAEVEASDIERLQKAFDDFSGSLKSNIKV
ncbi:MAG: ParB/RepB/Spo0J family partition protein [Dissulfurispiraceae bacterium]